MDRNAKAVVPGLCCAVVRQLVGQGVFWLAVLLTGAAQAAPKVGEVPPTYVGVDAEGNAVDLFGFKGKVVVITFWASWCGYCLKEIPVLENVQRQAGDGRIRVIAVNIDDDNAKRRQMRARLKDFQLLMTTDKDKKARKAYGVGGIPHLVMIDPEGKLAYRHVGYDKEMLPEIVDELNGLLEEADDAAEP